MPSTAKDLSLGLFIGMSATALIAAAVYFSTSSSRSIVAVPTPMVMPSMLPAGSPTSLPPPTPTASFTPLPTQAELQASPTEAPATITPDPVLTTVNTGGLIFTGPLPNAKQVALYRASLYYIRSTPLESRILSKEINGVGYGDPTNICGPLAMAILRDAGLVTPELAPHDFWLLNPTATTDQRLLAAAFPPDTYSHSKVSTALNRVNWRETPLVPGDFLFIWHGSGGNFDHMLVVSRVDSNLRTYAVTNYGTPEGYVIAEAMLYDPEDSNAGLFHTWTKQRQAILGATGFGGYEIWRVKQP